MKRTLYPCLIALILIFLASGRADAMELSKDGAVVSTSVELVNGTAYAPLRDLLNALGNWRFTWDGSIRTATAHGEIYDLAFPVGNATVLVDGYGYPAGPIYLSQGGRTYVPVRAVANLAGADVIWNGHNKPIQLVPRTTYRDYSEEDFYWLSRIISAESQGEVLRGQVAVGHVVLNRVENRQFPDTIKGVIFDDKYAIQFEPVANGTVYNEPTKRSILAAKMALNGVEAVGESLYFFAPALSQGTWITQNRTFYTAIGCHNFYL